MPWKHYPWIQEFSLAQLMVLSYWAPQGGLLKYDLGRDVLLRLEK